MYGSNYAANNKMGKVCLLGLFQKQFQCLQWLSNDPWGTFSLSHNNPFRQIQINLSIYNPQLDYKKETISTFCNHTRCLKQTATSLWKQSSTKIVCEIPRSFERASSSHFRTQGSFTILNSRKIFERDLLSSDSVAKSATQKTLGFLRLKIKGKSTSYDSF